MEVFTLESTAFENNGIIPKRYGYKNGNNSPPLKITGIPEKTETMALIMDDPDAMEAVGKIWVHWTVWNLVPSMSEITENHVPPKCKEGLTDFNEIGYGGPAPPDKEHTYVLKLYALDKILNLDSGATKKQLEDAMRHNIISETTLKGRYSP